MDYSCHAVHYTPMTYFIRDKMILRGLQCPFAVIILIEKNHAELYPQKAKSTEQTNRKIVYPKDITSVDGIVLGWCLLGTWVNARVCHYTLYNSLRIVIPPERARTGLLDYICMWSDTVVFRLCSLAFEGSTGEIWGYVGTMKVSRKLSKKAELPEFSFDFNKSNFTSICLNTRILCEISFEKKKQTNKHKKHKDFLA